MDAGTIGICVSSAAGIGLLLAGWIWDTRNKVGSLEGEFQKELGLFRKDFHKEISEVKEELERHGTMIEPFWNTLCDNLPAILKMHNSPDPLVTCLEGQPTIEEIDALITRITNELKIALDKDDSKAYGYILALAMAKAKRKWVEKQREKSGNK